MRDALQSARGRPPLSLRTVPAGDAAQVTPHQPEMRRGEVRAQHSAPQADGGGFREDYARQIDRAIKAWEDPQAWEGDRNVMGTATPAADVGAMLIMEMVLHGWDVARATGQEYHADDAVAEILVDTVQENAELFRKYQGFAHPIEVKPDAPAFDRALALSGRDPGWGRS